MLILREDDEDEDADDDGFGREDGDGSIYQQQRPAFTVTAEYRDPNSRRRVDISRGLQKKSLQQHEAEEKEKRSMIDAAESSKALSRTERDSVEGDEEAEEDSAWERQQIQKAVSNKVQTIFCLMLSWGQWTPLAFRRPCTTPPAVSPYWSDHSGTPIRAQTSSIQAGRCVRPLFYVFSGRFHLVYDARTPGRFFCLELSCS